MESTQAAVCRRLASLTAAVTGQMSADDWRASAVAVTGQMSAGGRSPVRHRSPPSICSARAAAGRRQLGSPWPAGLRGRRPPERPCGAAASDGDRRAPRHRAGPGNGPCHRRRSNSEEPPPLLQSCRRCLMHGALGGCIVTAAGRRLSGLLPWALNMTAAYIGQDSRWLLLRIACPAAFNGPRTIHLSPVPPAICTWEAAADTDCTYHALACGRIRTRTFLLARLARRRHRHRRQRSLAVG